MANTQRIPVLVDTREQSPWSLDTTLFAPSVYTLPTGDYSFPDMQHTFCLERKSLGDLVSTVIHGRTRFRKELLRMSSMDFAAIVVEADSSDVWERRYESEATPQAVMMALAAYTLEHGVQVFFAGPRPRAQEWAGYFLALAWKKLTGVR